MSPFCCHVVRNALQERSNLCFELCSLDGDSSQHSGKKVSMGTPGNLFLGVSSITSFEVQVGTLVNEVHPV
jgi:hypothetical protein